MKVYGIRGYWMFLGRFDGAKRPDRLKVYGENGKFYMPHEYDEDTPNLNALLRLDLTGDIIYSSDRTFRPIEGELARIGYHVQNTTDT